MAIVALLSLVLTTAKADNITVDGTNRTYNVIVPTNLGENRPLLIFCHGYSQDANWMQNSEFKDDNVSMEAVCDTAKFICVFPNGISNAWELNGDRDIKFIKAIIEKMATQYKIDRNRIYLGGFSMGGMLTYTAINKLADIIAAFISCSGPQVVTPSASTRPVPILHIQGTADNFSNVQPALNPWISHNGCSTTAKTVNNYNGFSGAKMHTWGPGNDGVEVKLLELKDKGHWICKEPQVYTGKEIWNFCKKYSLNKTAPIVSITSPKAGLTYTNFAPTGEATFPAINITAKATDPNGTVERVDFYDGSTLIATCTEAPYKATLTDAKPGKRTLKVVATDNDGETGSSTVDIALNAPSMLLYISQGFTENGSVPVGWITYDGNEKRTGYSSGYTSGCRVFQFTGSQHAFDYGLYFRNVNGTSRAGYVKYAPTGTDATLTLAPGKYTLKYKICNWNQSNFSPVDICVEKRNGTVIASSQYTPRVNIGNSASNSFGSVALKTFQFEVPEAGEYVLAFYTADAGWADGVIGDLQLYVNGYMATAIEDVRVLPEKYATATDGQWHDLSGRMVRNPMRGVYIRDGKKVWVK